MIQNTIASHFPEVIRARGQQLFAARAVSIAHAGSDLVLAVVQGSIPYTCTMKVVQGELSLNCSCPYAIDGNACKHVWALLLTTDANGALAALLMGSVPIQSVLINQDPGALDEPFDTLATTPPPPMSRPPEKPSWEHALERARWRMEYAHEAEKRERVDWPADRRLVYIIDAAASRHANGIAVEIGTEKQSKDGSWGAPKHFGYPTGVWFAAPDRTDHLIARMLLGAAPLPDYGRARTSFILPPHNYDPVLRMICETGRARLRTGSARTYLPTLRWDEGSDPESAWRFSLEVKRTRSGEHVLEGALLRGSQRMALDVPDLLHESGVLIARDALARFEHHGVFPLISELQSVPGMAVGRDVWSVVSRLYALPRVPEFILPADITLDESHAKPTPVLTLVADPEVWSRRNNAGLELSFAYGDVRVRFAERGPTRFDPAQRVLHHRRLDVEQAARDRLMELGASSIRFVAADTTALVIPQARASALAARLTRDGWRVETDGKAFHAAGTVSASVRSGVDWFDLDGVVNYGELSASLASVLDAQQRGEETVLLNDGSYGLLPTDWLSKLGPLFVSGVRTEQGTRFRKTQLSLLNALLATMPDVDLDDTFAQARERLAGFSRITPAEPPPGFVGVLREYQREGLGWMHFLREFGFGGCLADDMGLGKTIQVLALLEARRAEGHGPSLVVVPRSLVFNWRREAERFTPNLRVLDWSSTERRVDTLDTSNVDMLLVTYGTLRRDVVELGAITFDYIVLDEAQAIKNSATATAKATRLLNGRHRLALSGTPIENRIEELWSVLDFLNPGMLGASTRFAAMLRRDAAHENGSSVVANESIDTSPETSADGALARALRPVILRRTKAEVAPELPERLETTLEVEMEPKQRAFYNGMRDRYRASLLQRVARDGLHKSRMHILEALLRLRQAACHPALADPKKHALPSAKLDALLPALLEVSAEGNKALVFSQFTGFLTLVRAALDAEGVVYEYLDGRTRDRQARVDRFQDDPACPVFLISLKAGGHGLNLTAADYVYLLDPWWNPAVEAQAIDRAHRIGRTRRVIATRLVARDTIEEKILQLQASKRALADAILTADKGVMASIGREELELLLG